MKTKALILTLVLAAAAGSLYASNFRAADTVYMPAAGRLQGVAFFKTDVFVTNVDDSPAVVTVAYLPTGETNDYSDSSSWTTVELPQLAAGATVELEDIIGNTFGLSGGFGHLLFFACAPNQDCTSCDGGNCRTIVVEGRVYAEAQGSACPNGTSLCTLGQLFSGLPWYSYASSSLVGEGQDKVKILGIRQFGDVASRTGYRSNMGFVNASATSSITLRITLFDENDQQFGQTSLTLGPLTHTQKNISTLFAGFTGTGYAIVEQTGGSSSAGFFAYGSTLDNTSDDPTTLESTFLKELDWFTVFGAKPGNGIPRLIHHPGR